MVINRTGYDNYNNYNMFFTPANASAGVSGTPTDKTGVSATDAAGKVQKDSEASRTGKGECQTCSERKYVDGSNECDVSFKTPGHIDPDAALSVVSAHEREHVANAIQKGNEPGAKLIQASVRIKTAICPECGRSYVSGGVTSTKIQYSTTPYDENKKKTDSLALTGANIDESL